MPLICIGPVCIPISAVLPLVLWLVKPAWEALPASVREGLEAIFSPIGDWWSRHVWRRGKGTACENGVCTTAQANGNGALKRTVDAPNEEFAAKLRNSLVEAKGEVHNITTICELAAAKAVSAEADRPLVIDFTATWCGPCTKVKPLFYKLAEETPQGIFCVVDVDEAQDVQPACKVVALPTFQVYHGYAQVQEYRGGTDDAIEGIRACVKDQSVPKKGH